MTSITTKLRFVALTAAILGGVSSNSHAALDLSGASYVTYGDGNSYGLQINGVIAGSTGPGSLYYVNSTPGAIKDLIVVATGASGGPVTTNAPGMDDALSTPSGVSGSNFFSGIWTSTLTAFTNFLGADNPLFFFNNNQVNSGAATNQNVAVWAQVSLTGAGQTTMFFDFTNNKSPYALFTEGGGGQFMGDVTLYTSTGSGPLAGTNSETDYVFSGGAVCLNSSNVPVSCTDPSRVGGAIDNNLGANQAAYAIDAPELNDFLAEWRKGGFAGFTDINIDLRYGCDPATGVAGLGDCIGRDANNGYEQLFIGTSKAVDQQVPEPGVLGLVALAMLGLMATIRRRKA